ncbi:MAG: hypothetical protein E5X48_15860 [Mesorhizobium sp.]|uniref:hypothetical protein n=1 Tax=Mesorhizobium sp. TaxID=1871066 RepID=UPI0011FEF6C0|nr:hypothetical protein [Mesorhizobium sp.]TIQ34943.1 MAG: hypothetical protein E5X48_15860 [Mesorhizobium sp.]
MNPLLVPADEPNGNLDTASAQGMFELARRFDMERGTTFLVVPHNHDPAAWCDLIVELVDGRLTGDRHNPATHGVAESG